MGISSGNNPRLLTSDFSCAIVRVMTCFQGQRVRAARAAAGLTQRELAEAADISLRTVIYAETDDHVPGGATLARIAKALDVTIDSLFADEAVR